MFATGPTAPCLFGAFGSKDSIARQLLKVGGLTFAKGYSNVANVTADYAVGSSTGTYTQTIDATHSATVTQTTAISDWASAIPHPDALDATNQEIWSMCEFNGYMYIGYFTGGTNALRQAVIYKWDGSTLTLVKQFGTGTTWESVTLCVYQGSLYAGISGTGAGTADIWVSNGTDDATWVLSYTDPAEHSLCNHMCVFQNKLYACFGFSVDDGDVFVFDGVSWTLSFDGTGVSYNAQYLAEYNGKLYVATRVGTAPQIPMIYAFDGATWTLSYDGTGDTTHSEATSLAVFNGKLYAGLIGSNSTGAPILQFDGATWTDFYFILPGNRCHALIEYNGNLYAGNGNVQGQAEVWKYDGSSWTKVFDSFEGETFRLYKYKKKLYAGMGFRAISANIYSYSEVAPYVNTVTASNTPRLMSGYYGSSGFVTYSEYRSEIAATNLSLYSTDITNAAWAKSSTVADVDDSVYLPNGNNGLTNTIRATGANGTLLQSITFSSAARTFSVYMRRKNGTGTVSITADGTNYTDVTANISSNYWVRVSDTRTVADATFGFKLATSGDSVYIWGAQLEAGSYPTSFIPTVATSIDRNTDVLSYVISNNRTVATETVVVKFRPSSTWISADRNKNYLTDTDTKQRTVRHRGTSEVIAAFPNQTDFSAVGAVGTTTPVGNTSYVVAGVFADATNDAIIYLNGASEGVSSTNTWDGTAAWGTNFQVGSDNAGANQLNGGIKYVAIYNRALTAAEVARVNVILGAV